MSEQHSETPIAVTLPDGSQRNFPAPVTGARPQMLSAGRKP